MTTETAVPDTLRDVYARYREIAPEVDPEGSCTAWHLSRYLLVNAIRANARAEYEVLNGGGLSTSTLAELHGCFAAVHALESNRIVPDNPTRAIVAAAEIAEAIRDGGGIGEWLWEHSRHLGISINEVTRLAEAEARLKAASTGPSDKERADKAEQLAREHERVMYAALLDLTDGDHGDSESNLRQQLEGVTFPDDWDGTESGTEWLERTDPANSTAAGDCPGEAVFPDGRYPCILKRHGRDVAHNFANEQAGT